MVDDPYPQTLDYLATGIVNLTHMLMTQGMSKTQAAIAAAVWYAFHDDAHTGPEE